MIDVQLGVGLASRLDQFGQRDAAIFVLVRPGKPLLLLALRIGGRCLRNWRKRQGRRGCEARRRSFRDGRLLRAALPQQESASQE